jgi:hypothetical protein
MFGSDEKTGYNPMKKTINTVCIYCAASNQMPLDGLMTPSIPPR